MKKTIILILALVCAITATAQGVADAFLYSQGLYQGTAKSTAMGGALGAVGADMTSTCINPAGQGLYRTDELATTISFTENFVKSTYYGESDNGSKFRFTIPNFNYTFVNNKGNNRKLLYTQFGISLTRTNDFNFKSSATGINPNSSKIDSYLAQINGYRPDELESNFGYTAYPAWETYLIDTVTQNGQQYYTSPVPQGNIRQYDKISSKGHSQEWTFAYSANFENRFFIGASFGLAHIKRNTTNTFSEAALAGTDTNFRNWNFEENIKSSGTGCNLKIGAIIYPSDRIRAGFAYHTPTLYGFDESWATSTDARFSTGYYKYDSETSTYQYNFISPGKMVASMAFIVPQQGMFTADFERMNYGKAKFDCDDYDYSSVNKDIKEAYGATYNMRFGMEWLVQNICLRGGCAYYGSPYGFGKPEGSVKKIGCGLSVSVSESTCFDFSYELTRSLWAYYPYLYYNNDALAIESVNQTKTFNSLAVTLRIKY